MLSVLLCPSSGLPANIQLDIDGDRETERIYSLFNLYMSKLEKMQGEDEGGVSLSHPSQQLGGRLAQATRGPFCRVIWGGAGSPRPVVLPCVTIPREGPPPAERSPLAEDTCDSVF